jgi:predicted Fe-Mo cluster-binding NifX family protein
MKVCFPVESFQGLDSRVYGHFGSAPGFAVLDTEGMNVEELHNEDLHHAHGMCQPVKALGGARVDAVVVGGIGMGALSGLTAAGIEVYRGVEGTVSENAKMLKDGKLPVFSPEHTCAGHHDGAGCGH